MAENQAAEFLIDQGITIITRNFSSRRGEIDLIGLDGNQLIFFEVKQRSGNSSNPADATGRVKLIRIRKAIEDYLKATDQIGRDFRLEMVAITDLGISRLPIEANIIAPNAEREDFDESDIYEAN